MKKILLAGVVGTILVGCYDQETRDEMSYLKHPYRAEEILKQCEARFTQAMEKQDSKAIIAIEKDPKCRAAGKVLHELRQMEREHAADQKAAASTATTSTASVSVATADSSSANKAVNLEKQAEKAKAQPSSTQKVEQVVVHDAEVLAQETSKISENLITQNDFVQAHDEGERLAELAQNQGESTTETKVTTDTKESTDSKENKVAVKEEKEVEALRKETDHKDRQYGEHSGDWQVVMNRYINSDCAHATGYPTADCVAMKEQYREAMMEGREMLWGQSFSELLGDSAKYCQDGKEEAMLPIKGSSCELWYNMRDKKGKLALLDLDVFGVEAQQATYCRDQESSLCQIWNQVWEDKSAELSSYLTNNDAAFATTYNRCYQEIMEIDDSTTLRREKIEKEKAIRTSTPCMQAAEAYRNRHLGERAFMHTIEVKK